MANPIKIKGVKLSDGVTVLADGFYPTATNKVAFADVTQNAGSSDTTLTQALAAKADASTTYTKTQVDTALAGKAASDHTHTGIYTGNDDASVEVAYSNTEGARIIFKGDKIVGDSEANPVVTNLSSSTTSEAKIPTSGAVVAALGNKLSSVVSTQELPEPASGKTQIDLETEYTDSSLCVISNINGGALSTKVKCDTQSHYVVFPHNAGTLTNDFIMFRQYIWEDDGTVYHLIEVVGAWDSQE